MCRPADLSSALPVYTTTTTTTTEEEEEGKDIMQSEGRGPLERVRRPGRLLSSSCVRRRKSRGDAWKKKYPAVCMLCTPSHRCLNSTVTKLATGGLGERERVHLHFSLSFFFYVSLLRSKYVTAKKTTEQYQISSLDRIISQRPYI